MDLPEQKYSPEYGARPSSGISAPPATRLFAVSVPTTALAQPTEAELAAARDLFLQVRKLEDQGQWAEASQRLDAIAKVRMTPQVRFHIALCDEHLGRLVSALNGFQQARVEAGPAGAAEVAEESEQHIAALQPRIPSLRIALPADTPSPSVQVDGQPVVTALLAVPLPLDPGQHAVVVEAPGRSTFARDVALSEGQSLTLEVVLPKAEPPPAAAPPVPESPRNKPAPTPMPARQPPEPPSSSAPGWIVMGAGGALLVGAGVAALVRSSAISDIDKSCPSHIDCDPSLENTRSRAQTSGTIAAVLGATGVATVAAGGVLLYLSTKSSSHEQTAVLAPVVSSRGAGFCGVVRW